MDQEFFSQLDRLFDPESVAIIGLPKGMKTGKLFLIALKDMGFSGPIYAVNPNAKEIDGIKSYSSVLEIPNQVDLAIILVPTENVLKSIEDCAAKGVKGAVLFTAGGKELGTKEGLALENRMFMTAKSSGMRLFGPNCMGLYSPRTGLSFFPGLSKEPGSIGLISHSGSLTNIIGRIAAERGIAFSKVVSLGNECDLNSAHFLAYFGQDPETRIIGAYLEDIKNGKEFVRELKRAAAFKPVILWKVGLTPEGGKAAASHTGSLAGSRDVWRGVIRQTGAVSVEGWEAWVDALMSFSLFPERLGERIAIISGPGGICVSAAEACGNAGLKLAELSQESKSALAEFVPPTGTSLSNPIDVSLAASLAIDIYVRAAQIAAADPNVDAVMVAGIGLNEQTNRLYTEGMIDAQRRSNKPFLVVNIPGFPSKLSGEFCRSGIPFFESSERAMINYAMVRKYQRQKYFEK